MKNIYLIVFGFLFTVVTISCTKEEQAKPVTESEPTEMNFKDEDDDEIIHTGSIGGTASPLTSIIELVNPVTKAVIATTLVNSNGDYLFTNLPSGDYILYVKIDGSIVDTLYRTI